MIRPRRRGTRTTRRASYEQERLRTLIESMNAGVIALDDRLRVEQYNGAALNILDSNASIKGAVITKHLQLVNREKQPVNLKHLIEDSTTASNYRNYRLMYPDGTWIALHLSISPVVHSYGKLTRRGYVLILRDITREKSLEEERNEFISVVSHELRTPIAIAEGSIGNAQYVVKREHGNKTVQKALDTAHEQVLFLADMINDLSTLSRAERGKLALDLEDININEMLAELVKGYAEQADAKGLTLRLKSPRKQLVLHSSRLYVQEVLQNLITNAIKYTKDGGVTISARHGRTGVSVSVTDTGIGISKSDQDKIFDKFFRSEDYRTRESAGTGLGLYVTVKLLELLHADIDLESTLNSGSTFTVTFPDLA